jgi:hypothetical protein
MPSPKRLSMPTVVPIINNNALRKSCRGRQLSLRVFISVLSKGNGPIPLSREMR